MPKFDVGLFLVLESTDRQNTRLAITEPLRFWRFSFVGTAFHTEQKFVIFTPTAQPQLLSPISPVYSSPMVKPRSSICCL